MNATREQIVFLAEFGLCYPLADCIAGWFGNFKLNWPRGFLLHHCGAGRNVFAMADIAYPQFDQVAGSQFAIEPQVKHGEFTNPVLKLKTDSNSPNLFQFER